MMSIGRTAHVALVAGQSNAVGWDTTAAEVPENLLSAPGQYVWTGSAFAPLQNGVNNGALSSNGEKWGPEAEFGRQWRRARPSTSLWIIKHATGGSALADAWASGGADRVIFDAEVAQGLASLNGLGLTPNVVALLWMQGESDSQDITQANAYEANLTAWLSHVRTVSDAPLMAALIGRIANQSAWTYRTTVRAAQSAVVAADSRSALIDTDGYGNDGVHYDIAGNIALGADMHSALLGLT